MPELPEVEIVCRGMVDAVIGKDIKSVVVNRYDLRVPIPQDFGQSITGKAIKNLERRGKYIIMHLGDNIFAILHLGMSGRIRIFRAGDTYEPRKHDHIVITMNDGTLFAYEDPRRFGMFYLSSENWRDKKPFSVMGAEPLESEWTADDLLAALGRKKSPIKTALLDQRVVAGLGNIYVCEALFRSKISPERLSNTISKDEAVRIVKHSKEILLESIESGGSTLKDYQHTDGSLGYFQHGFAVYNQEGEDCTNQGCSAQISRIVQGGRSTFYCASCQK